MTIFNQLKSVSARRGAAFIVLLDPDKIRDEELPVRIEACVRAGVDAFFVGGSLVQAPRVDAFVRGLKKVTDLPIVGFPGAVSQLTPAYDALLYLSIVSGRNPEYLIGQHVHAAPLIRQMKLEPIPTAYMLVESGRLTTAQYMNQSLPLPRSKPDVAAATALAAEFMGMQLMYVDGGSGAEWPVPTEMIQAIKDVCASPVVVGGGLRTPEAIRERVEAGASFIVVGNAFEDNGSSSYISEMAIAAHTKG
jgi:putative glycerol-1-phosphate prenyltransferase